MNNRHSAQPMKKNTLGDHMKEKKKQKRHPLLWIMIILCICLMLISGYQLINQYLLYKVAVDEYKDLSAIAYDDVGEADVNFPALQQVNMDGLAWITIEDTNIDYPIVQGEDNDYYLHHTFNGTESSSGAIFMECSNSPDFSDQNTIIYGHNMKNGSMFRDLSNYKDQSFYDEHPTFTIYTPTSTYTCEVIAAFVCNPDSDIYTISFEDSALFLSLQNSARASSLIQTAGVASEDAKIVTLSTCDYTYSDARMVVMAQMIEQ